MIPVRIVFTPARQFWRVFAYVMQVHENHYIKRAGVAGIRARARILNCCYLCWKLSSLDDSFLIAHVGRFVGCESQPVLLMAGGIASLKSLFRRQKAMMLCEGVPTCVIY